MKFNNIEINLMDTRKINKERKTSNQFQENKSELIIKDFYGDEYNKIISSFKEMEDKTKNYFKEFKNKLDEKFKDFNSYLEKFVSNIANKYSKIFELNEDRFDKEKIVGDKIQKEHIKIIQSKIKMHLDKLTDIKNLYEQILDNIKLESSIFLDSFDIPKNLEKAEPINDFLEKEFDNIVNSWLFNKIDFQNFNFIKAFNNSKLDEALKNLVLIFRKNKTFIMEINPVQKKEDKQDDFTYEEMQIKESNYIFQLADNLTKIKINKMKNIDLPFQSSNNFPKLKKLEIKNCLLSKNEEKYSLIGKCDILEKLVFNGVFNFELKLLQNLSKNLTKLILSNNNFINTDYKNIMNNYIINSPSLKEKLEFLSFSNNNLTNIKFFSELTLFNSLKEIDFNNNKISKININDISFNDNKSINLCYNNFSRNEIIGNKNILVLLSGNLFLTDIEQCKNYYNKLETQLKDYKINLTNLALSFLKKEFAEDLLERIIINKTILINLKKLDLSYNNITCSTLFNFFQNNLGFINLKELNLSGNELDDTFFEKFLDNDYQNIFTRIRKINLNDNLIGNDSKINIEDIIEKPEINDDKFQEVYKLRLIYKFIEKNKYLSKLYFTKNPMSQRSKFPADFDINNYTSEVKRDERNQIIIDSFYSFLKKIQDELLMSKEERDNRGQFNIKFDINTKINLDLDNIHLK